MNAWQANAGRGRTKALVALFLIVPIGFLTLIGVFVAVNWDEFMAGYEAALAEGFRNPQPPDGAEDVVAIGEVVDLVDDLDADLGAVTVLRASRPEQLPDGPPSAGFRYVAALVTYNARAQWDYSPLDWSARDEHGRRFGAVAVPLSPALETGSLAADRQVAGWLAFQVPDGAAELWLDFLAWDGSVIFTVQIDGTPHPIPPDDVPLPVT